MADNDQNKLNPAQSEPLWAAKTLLAFQARDESGGEQQPGAEVKSSKFYDHNKEDKRSPNHQSSPCRITRDGSYHVDASGSQQMSCDSERESEKKPAARETQNDGPLKRKAAENVYMDNEQSTPIDVPGVASEPTMAITLETKAVCFGWIKHPYTKRWRKLVKTFSDSHDKYPDWSDDICNHVKAELQQEDGFEGFFFCQRPAKTRKLIDEENKWIVTWIPASDQEVLNRTKWRFNDCRKESKKPRTKATSSKSLPPTGVKLL